VLIVSITVVVVASIVTVGLATVLSVTELAYSHLLSENDQLSGKYDALLGIYDKLAEEKENLTKRYQELAERYKWLDQPLKNRTVPSVRELELWLQIDETDRRAYGDPDFTCLHFSVLLMLNARARHYYVGVVAVYGYNNRTKEPFSHSINAVITTEGLVYIEPQLDRVWWLQDHSEITGGNVHRFPISQDPIYVVETATFFDY